MFFHKYPETDFHELNLDFILRTVHMLQEQMGSFLRANSIEFSDPLLWSITSQYQKNIIVIDDNGNAYLTLKPVPKGIDISNTEYWMLIFNFENYIMTANRNLTDHVEMNVQRATMNLSVGDWLLLDNVLYRVISTIHIDDIYVVNTNIRHFTVEDFLTDFTTTITNMVIQYKADIDASELQYKNEIDASELQYKNELVQQIQNTTASLQAQLDAAIAGATVDSEVINARVGISGTIYPTLGDAIRRQIDNRKLALYNYPYENYYSDECKDDYYLDSAGAEQSQVGWSISNYLKINKWSVYNIPSATDSPSVYCWFYNSNYGLISGFQTDVIGRHELFAPANAVYVRFSIKTAEKSSFSYWSLIYPQVTNYFHPDTLHNTFRSFYYKEHLYDGYYLNPIGDIATGSSWYLSELFSVNEGDVIYIKEPFGQWLNEFDADREFVTSQNDNIGNPINFVVPSGIKYIAFNLLKSTISTQVVTINDIPLGAKYRPVWCDDNRGVWSGKSYISHGDSITWQDGKAYIQGEHIGEIAKGYQTVFANKVSLGRYMNMGKSGWSLARVGGNGIVDTIMSIANYAAFDLVSIFVGTNDFKLNVPLGTLGQIGDTTFDDTTFYGAYRKSIEYILSQGPGIRIVLLTPMQRDNDGYDVNYVNSAGCKLIDYVNATKDVGNMYGIPVCDMYANSSLTKKTLDLFTMDGLHPNDVGYKRIGDYFTEFVNAIGN